MNDTSVQTSQGYILIVDDQPDNLRLLSTTLTNAGYKVKNAISAQMALIGIQNALPELILLDIMMPDMNGYELCQTLKADTQTKDIPVIFLSALDAELDKVKAFDLGGTDYITKPFQTKEVLARVKHQLTIVRQQQTVIEQKLQLQQLNSKLVQVNEELLRSNKELEQFAYLASHDLRSPLQTMKAFAQLLAQKYHGLLDKKAERYITRIIEAGNCMDQLLQDLLNYSRVGTCPREVEPTDCNMVLEQVLNNLHAEIDASGAVINYEKLPTVMGDRMQLVQLFQNLIANALKFRRTEVPPQIKISVEPRKKVSSLSSGVPPQLNSTKPTLEGETDKDIVWLFGVQDNGIGIEPEYFERIFQVFQRLHTSEEYPGTGIGLSICKKIVEHHGGSIWVESFLNVGTTFYFMLMG